MVSEQKVWPVEDDAVDATLLASRALLGIVARSILGVLGDVTLPQFRVLVILESSGPLRMGAIAARMGTHPSTLSRSVDRLVAAGWVDREVNRESRRETLVALSSRGRELVDRVTATRRAEIRRVLTGMPPEQREVLRTALEAFSVAAGETDTADTLVLGM
ncbi:MAG: hypothetical protein BGO04_02760 [Microbacterium sp. 70-38]|nr:MAG: hypothetical protein BGO04_02760 [Microbacterium sp. 70-38]